MESAKRCSVRELAEDGFREGGRAQVHERMVIRATGKHAGEFHQTLTVKTNKNEPRGNRKTDGTQTLDAHPRRTGGGAGAKFPEFLHCSWRLVEGQSHLDDMLFKIRREGPPWRSSG